LLIDLDSGRAARSSLIATAGARKLEERLVGHLPGVPIASRGQTCQMALPADAEGIEQIAAALPLVRESAGIVHLPPSVLRPILEETRIRPTATLLRADLTKDRALTALTTRDLTALDLRVAVLKRPPGWLAGRAAQLGVLPAGGGAFAFRLRERLLTTDDRKFRQCYDGKDEPEGESQENQKQVRQGSAPARWWNEGRRPHEAQERE
jgi:hypothetical protein